MKGTKKTYKSEKSTLRDYIGALKGVKVPWIFLLLILAASIGSTFAGLHISFFTGDMVDAQGNVPTDDLISFVGCYGALAICAAAGVVFGSLASEKINLGLRMKLWRKIMYTRQSSYDIDGGESLVSRVTTDCDFASKLLTTIVEMLSIAVSLGIYISRMYRLNARMSAYMLLLIPISVLCGWIYAKLKFLIAQKSQAMLSRTTTYLVERTGNIPLIKTACAQDEEITLGKENFDEQYKMQLKSGLMDVFYSCLQTAFSILSILIPFLIGAELVSKRVIRAGAVIAFYTIAGTVGTEATNLINSVGAIRQANGALSRVIRALKQPDEADNNGLKPVKAMSDLTVDEIDFSYGEGSTLSKVSCSIPKGKITAVIGANGSGKSTLFKLLERFYEPSSGEIRLGDTPAEEFDIHSWRKAFCLVEQGSPMMEGTIRENICYGCNEPVSDERMIEIAKRAGIYDFVSRLPEGFDAPVAAGGANFSGGQRQCLAIARAMMNDPECLLLDEPTGNMDATTEKRVLDALSELMKDRTTVMIAHSLSAIRRADHVIIMRNGSVEASGSPASILSKTGNYLSKLMNRRKAQNA